MRGAEATTDVPSLPHRLMLTSRATSCGLSRATCSDRGRRWQLSNTGCDRSRRGEPGGAWHSGQLAGHVQGAGRSPSPGLSQTPRLPPQTPHSRTSSLSLPGQDRGPVTKQGTLPCSMRPPSREELPVQWGRPGHAASSHGAETEAGGVEGGGRGPPGRVEEGRASLCTHTSCTKAEEWHVTLGVCVCLWETGPRRTGFLNAPHASAQPLPGLYL